MLIWFEIIIAWADEIAKEYSPSLYIRKIAWGSGHRERVCWITGDKIYVEISGLDAQEI